MSKRPNVLFFKALGLISSMSRRFLGHWAREEHFPQCQWADFVRNLSGRERSAIMQQHLNRGCVACIRNVEIWKAVVEFASHEAMHSPPDWLVRKVKASFHRVQTSCETKNVGTATLVFDSMWQAMGAGVRAGPTSGRQLLYKSGTMSIDLQISSKPNSESLESMVLVGQLLDEFCPRRNIPVSLMRDGALICTKITSELGEFGFALDMPAGMYLAFDLGDATSLTVHLPNPIIGHDSQLRA